MGAKPWQIAVIVVGLLVGGGLVLYQSMYAGGIPVNTKFTLLDPMTGQLYAVDWNDQHFELPARDPNSNDPRLVRVFMDGGKWRVIDRDMPIIDHLPPEKNTIVDAESGHLKTEPKSAIRYSIKTN